VLVLEHHIKRDVLGRWLRRNGRRYGHAHVLARLQFGPASSATLPSTVTAPLGNQLLEARPADLREGGNKHAVEPFARFRNSRHDCGLFISPLRNHCAVQRAWPDT
jgi:hypothetical protein